VDDPRRLLPSVDRVLHEERLRPLVAEHGRALVRSELRRLLADARAEASPGGETGLRVLVDALPEALGARLARRLRPSLVSVLNATGVVVHTNLGRAPLPRAAAERVAAIAAGYSNLELDLATGERGDREVHVETRLRGLLGAEATAVVNNGAAAVLLAVNTLAEGREVLVSRGELVEIGGSFRIPDVVRKGGARLREVGTTNRTRLSDYRAALGPETALVLKVHPSNFRIVGFTESPTLDDLARLASEAGVPLLEDQGSGLLQAPRPSMGDEPTAGAALAAGADLVALSGDKLLGGPQAGILAGRRVLLEAVRRNPLYRALRVDKMTLAALEAVLVEHEAERAAETVPVLRMLALTEDDLGPRAEALARGIREAAPGLLVEITAGSSAVGGGAAPTLEVATVLVALRQEGVAAGRLAARLREGEPPVVVRVAEEQVLVDLRTVPPEADEALRAALAAALRG
jgi:L-seryl-tRNA(Ser) seleniumtransferase